jgi:hypothetical protein
MHVPNPRPSQRRQLFEAVCDALSAEEGLVKGRRVIVEACPLAQADKLLLHLPERRDIPVLLVTTDLDDPLPAWRETRMGRRRNEQVHWKSASELAESHKGVRAAAARCRRLMNRTDTQASPRLSPVLPELLSLFDRKPRKGRNGWAWRKDDTLFAVLKGLHCGTHEALELRLTADGAMRWPTVADQLDPNSGDERYVGWIVLTPEAVSSFVAATRA